MQDFNTGLALEACRRAFKNLNWAAQEASWQGARSVRLQGLIEGEDYETLFLKGLQSGWHWYYDDDYQGQDFASFEDCLKDARKSLNVLIYKIS